jgi:phosphoenolpyruvate-protein kinase (PTS system EI component)
MDWWVIIVIVAIVAGSFDQWVKLNSKQRDLGTSAGELEKAVAEIKEELKAQQQKLEQRVANLETIITSQTWDVLQDPKLSHDDKKILTQGLGSELEELKSVMTDTRKVELLASKLK